MQAPDDEVEKYSYISTLKRRKMAAMTNIMDQGIGQIVAALKKKKMLDNSIVVFISDNGAPTIGLHSNLGSNYPLRGVDRYFKRHLLFLTVLFYFSKKIPLGKALCEHLL